jgi:hypothetical protein
VAGLFSAMPYAVYIIQSQADGSYIGYFITAPMACCSVVQAPWLLLSVKRLLPLLQGYQLDKSKPSNVQWLEAYGENHKITPPSVPSILSLVQNFLFQRVRSLDNVSNFRLGFCINRS